MNVLLANYLFFDSERLSRELKYIYCSPDKYMKPQELLKYIVPNKLGNCLLELTKLLELILIIPVTTASSERSMSTLKRIKTYLRSTMTNQRLSKLAVISSNFAAISSNLAMISSNLAAILSNLAAISSNLAMISSNLAAISIENP